MRLFISRRCECCWSDDWRIAATAWRWNVASGFDSSAEENCLNIRSRDSVSSSATAVRTWCCTALEDSAPKWRSSTRVTCPPSGPNACSSDVCSALTTASDVWPSRCSTSRDADSRSCRSTSTAAPAYSRSSTRAPISIASDTTRAGFSPASVRARTSSAAQASSTTRFSISRRPTSEATRGWRSGVAAASMAEQSEATPHPRRNPHLIADRAPGGDHRRVGDQRTEKPLSPSGGSSAASIRSTAECPGLARQSSTIAATAASEPSNTASTVPSAQLRTQPATPRAAASRRTLSRKKTPCTRPCARTRRRTAGSDTIGTVTGMAETVVRT